ncbi:hypothetical protein QOZ96_003206 [Brevundimonas nasdae]|uniref:hypothetical protein n=1 Tax=Brevundimonas nasdae TaxID=172043 RepID=UPI0019148F77|nr:hypothetical protein [Brevundimonas nasdae]MBK6026664.1 hypothetical protein [Brevundimonas nasdae]MDQ0453241.1 hypothetical protein [Brevundimonas nasdae]
MARKIGFDKAVEFIRKTRLLLEKEAQDTDEFEKIVLRHTPRHWEEAAVILEEVAFNLQAGARCDGLDIVAVNRIGYWLRQQDADQRIKAATPIRSARAKAA